MNSRTVRSYFFSNNEVHEAIVAMLNAKGLPTPQYIGNAGTTRWTDEPKGVRVEWVEEDGT